MTESKLNDFVNIPEAVQRAKADGIPISEYAVRYWIRTGAIPGRKVGRQIILFYPHLVQYLKCEDGGDNDLVAATGNLSICPANATRKVANMEIRTKAKASGVRHWMIAEALGIQESAFCRMLRSNLSNETTTDILNIIDSIAKEQRMQHES